MYALTLNNTHTHNPQWVHLKNKLKLTTVISLNQSPLNHPEMSQKFVARYNAYIINTTPSLHQLGHFGHSGTAVPSGSLGHSSDRAVLPTTMKKLPPAQEEQENSSPARARGIAKSKQPKNAVEALIPIL